MVLFSLVSLGHDYYGFLSTAISTVQDMENPDVPSIGFDQRKGIMDSQPD